jgi:hypothetical protein
MSRAGCRFEEGRAPARPLLIRAEPKSGAAGAAPSTTASHAFAPDFWQRRAGSALLFAEHLALGGLDALAVHSEGKGYRDQGAAAVALNDEMQMRP